MSCSRTGLYGRWNVFRLPVPGTHGFAEARAYGNPHSANPASLASTHVAEHASKYVLEYFNAPPAEYDVIFTQNASGALKIVRGLIHSVPIHAIF